jgi:hypothetical protein
MSVQARLSNGVLLTLTSADADTRGWPAGEQKLLIIGDEGALTDDLDGSCGFRSTAHEPNWNQTWLTPPLRPYSWKRCAMGHPTQSPVTKTRKRSP